MFDFWDARRAARTASTTARTRRGTPTASRRRTASYVDEIAGAVRAGRRRDAHARRRRLNALLTSYLFLLWFDTRSGYQDTGPYPLDDGRVLLLRAFNRLGVSHFPWSADVSARRCRTATCSARSCSAASTCASPTSARR